MKSTSFAVNDRRLVPHDVEHWVIWSRVPIVNPSNERVDKLGLWGFTGTTGCEEMILPVGITLPPLPTQEETDVIGEACQEIEQYVRACWPEPQWECAWFMNPPVSGSSSLQRQKVVDLAHKPQQSVPGLAHVHVFARPKTLPSID